MTANYRLTIRSGPNPGEVFLLTNNEYSLGRESSNDIVISDPEVSRRHVRLFLQGTSYVIEDLGSTNGTSVSGQRLTGPFTLRPGDLITLGEGVSLLFESTQPEIAATVVSAPYQAPATVSPPAAAPQPQGYAGQVPSQPLPTPPPPIYGPAPEPEKRKVPIWLIVVVALVIIMCLCAGAALLIDSGGEEAWCSWFSWFFNMLSPGACP